MEISEELGQLAAGFLNGTVSEWEIVPTLKAMAQRKKIALDTLFTMFLARMKALEKTRGDIYART